MLSPLAARKAEKLGFKNVKVYHAGLPDWKKAGNIVVSNIAGIEELNKLEMPYILLDMRSPDEISKGHIPNAVAVPKEGMESIKAQFPTYKGAPIILYDQSGVSESTKAAYKEVAGWDYKQLSILSGGFQGWQTAGKTVATGPAETKITYVRKLFPGEIELGAFKAELGKPSVNTVILDVRMPSEVQDGMLPNTRQLPLDELEAKLSEIPKDKLILVHCATGARAEMAYTVLKNAGYNVKYLRAKLEFDKDNKNSYKFEE
ncbi:MAG: rhodanese-like domain-containing protein [Pseudomonadota bacterium]